MAQAALVGQPVDVAVARADAAVAQLLERSLYSSVEQAATVQIEVPRLDVVDDEPARVPGRGAQPAGATAMQNRLPSGSAMIFHWNPMIS